MARATSVMSVMFEIGSVLTTFLSLSRSPLGDLNDNVFSGLVARFLWFTVLFANFA